MTGITTHTHDAEKDSIREKDLTNVAVLERTREELNVSPEDDVRVRRRVDWILLPYLMTVYGLQFLDKTAMTYASVMGFREDNALTLAQYSWLSSIFYLGYIVGAYPMVLLQQRLPLAVLTGANITIWGGVLCFMAVAKGFAGLMVVRFFLGFFESSIGPALMLFTGMWYKKTEQGSRTGLWTACNSIGGIFGAAIAYGLYDADEKDKLSLPGWKVVYILLGVTTVFFGLLFFVVVPDRPEKAWFLSADDKVIARERLVNNHASVDREPFRMYQVREGLTDPLFYLYALISLVTCIPNGGITNFSAILVKGMGFDTRQTLLLGIANATLAIWIIGCMFLSDRLRNRCAMAFAPLLISIAGTAMIWGIPARHRAARLAGFYLVLPYAVPNILALSLVITNVAGRTKKTFYNGMFMVCYCAGNLIGPQTFRQQDAPTYVPAMLTLIVCNAVVLVLFAALWWVYARRNRERQAALEAGNVPPEEDIGKDLTDLENPHFRYTI